MTDAIALLCMLYPASPEKQERCLSLLRHSAREYYRQPAAKCTAWSYFTSWPPPKKSPSGKPPIIGGLELYTTKSALQAQVQDPVFFQSYHETVKSENLYAKPEFLQAWFSAGGFVVRDGVASAGGGVLISVTKMIFSHGQQDLAMHALKTFAQWVYAYEPGVLTYALFSRPKALEELLLLVRYRDLAALKKHSSAPEHVAVLKELDPLVDKGVDQSTTLWKEVEDSFVSDVVGGDRKVEAKL